MMNELAGIELLAQLCRSSSLLDHQHETAQRGVALTWRGARPQAVTYSWRAMAYFRQTRDRATIGIGIDNGLLAAVADDDRLTVEFRQVADRLHAAKSKTS